METALKTNGSEEKAQKQTVTYRDNGDCDNHPRDVVQREDNFFM